MRRPRPSPVVLGPVGVGSTSRGGFNDEGGERGGELGGGKVPGREASVEEGDAVRGAIQSWVQRNGASLMGLKSREHENHC